MKRYDIPFNCDCRALKETADGDYVLYSDHEAALAAAVAKEREACLLAVQGQQDVADCVAAIRARGDK